jgi:polo-like kinase 4
MSNTPQADIEILLQQVERNINRDSSGKDMRNAQTSNTSMRIRLSRQKRSVEIARCVPGPWGGEWTKKVLLATGRGVGIRESDLRGLHILEKEGINRLAAFLRVCEAVECLDVVDKSSGEAKKKTQDKPISKGRTYGSPAIPSLDEKHVESVQDQANTKINHSRPPKLTMAKSLRTVNVAPRPEKLSQRSEQLKSNSQEPGQSHSACLEY